MTDPMAKTACAALLLISLLGFGCASSQPKDASAEKAAPADQVAANLAAVPDDSPLAKVTLGMSDTEVRKILGEPTTQKNYQTGKAWIPYYFGSDTSRMDYIYKGLGRVVFSQNRYSGQLKVINLMYNPDETGS
jgi:outer membrane protein assembly factor BamE (lipoprotein component of BamABCDE complex)